MSTVVELSEAMVRSLDERSREEQVTQGELIRRAVESYLAIRLPSFEPKAAREPGPWPELENVLGAWRNPDGEELVGSWEGLDSLAYQRRIRAEWDR